LVAGTPAELDLGSPLVTDAKLNTEVAIGVITFRFN
jgi:hypothetical protein